MEYRTQQHWLEAADGTQLCWYAHPSKTGESGLPSLVLTNGIGTTEAFWRYLVEDLTPDHAVVHWNYRGHGSSGLSPSNDYSLKTQAADLERVTTAMMAAGNGVPPVHVGFSMGVAVVLELYRSRPELVRAMVLISGTARPPGSDTIFARLPGWAWALRKLLLALTPLMPLLQPPLNALVRTGWLYPAGRLLGLLRPLAPREQIDELLNEIAAMDPKAYWLTLGGLMSAGSSDVLPHVRVPGLIVAARNDPLAPLRQLRKMATQLPHAQFVEIADAGHAGLLEAGPAMAEAVGNFIRALPAAAVTSWLKSVPLPSSAPAGSALPPARTWRLSPDEV